MTVMGRKAVVLQLWPLRLEWVRSRRCPCQLECPLMKIRRLELPVPLRPHFVWYHVGQYALRCPPDLGEGGDALEARENT